MELSNKIDIWYLDESGFNVSKFPKYGWSRIGTTPYVKVPTKSTNISLLMAISRNKRPYYQLFEGGIKG